MGRLPDQVDANLQTANGLRQQLESISTQLSGEQISCRMSRRSCSNEAGQRLAALLERSRRDPAAPDRGSTRSSSSSRRHAHRLYRQAPGDHHLIGGDRQTQRRAGGGKQDGRHDAATMLLADPLYHQKVAERDASRRGSRSLQAAEASARGQIAAYQSRVEAAPMVEQDLASVQRDHELEKDALQRPEDEVRPRAARRGHRAQAGRRALQRALSGASLPVEPDARLKIMLMALAPGLMLGAALVVGARIRRPLRARRPCAAERVRTSGARGDPEHPWRGVSRRSETRGFHEPHSRDSEQGRAGRHRPPHARAVRQRSIAPAVTIPPARTQTPVSSRPRRPRPRCSSPVAGTGPHRATAPAPASRPPRRRQARRRSIRAWLPRSRRSRRPPSSTAAAHADQARGERPHRPRHHRHQPREG